MNNFYEKEVSSSENYFGELIRATGPMAKLNPFRFSTKYQDDETDLLYYGYRYYNASTGRWLSRDPIEEKGGLNLYEFVGNDPISTMDTNGKSAWDWGQAFKWLFNPIAGIEMTQLPWNRFDPDGMAGETLKAEWLRNNIPHLKAKCLEANIGSSVIPYSEFSEANMDFMNSRDIWISWWHGKAMVSPLKNGVSMDKDCKKCVFNYHLLFGASDSSNFNPGGSFGNLWILTQDDTWIFVRDNTPFGHDYKIYSYKDEFGDLTYRYGE